MLFQGRYKYSNEPNQLLIDSAHLLFDNKIITDFFLSIHFRNNTLF